MSAGAPSIDIDAIAAQLMSHPSFGVGAGQLVPFEDFRTIGSTGNPAFANAWVAFGSTYASPAFTKDHFGRVYLRGVMKTGAVGSACFTLPADYFPAADLLFPAASFDGAAYVVAAVTITSAGVVTPVAGNNNRFSLNGISFMAQ
jgi:hypothetical protein